MSFDITITPALPEYLEYTNKIYETTSEIKSLIQNKQFY